jgi:hypothetical protein
MFQRTAARVEFASMTQSFTFSRAGGHPANDDAFAVRRHPDDADVWLVCLADGQGGQSGGGEAARLACRVAMDRAATSPPRTLASPVGWCELLGQADHAVRDDARAGYTTLIGYCVVGGFVAGASCGDSAVLLAAAGTQPVELTAGQPKAPPVGSGVAPFRPFGAALGANWRLLALSDGFWKYAGWDRVRSASLTSYGQKLIDELATAARPPGVEAFADDFTVVLLESDGRA